MRNVDRFELILERERGLSRAVVVVLGILSLLCAGLLIAAW